jgi:hypothetical protein
MCYDTLCPAPAETECLSMQFFRLFIFALMPQHCRQRANARQVGKAFALHSDLRLGRHFVVDIARAHKIFGVLLVHFSRII